MARISGIERFERALLAGLRQRARYRLLRGRYFVVAGPRGVLPSTLRALEADAVAAAGHGRRLRSGYRVIPVSLASDALPRTRD